MAPLTNTPDHPGQVVAGYRVVEQLYLGSRTAVYRAVQESTQQPVVLKIMRREHPSFGELVQFRNQYTIAKNLPIPGIVQPLCLEPLGSGYALVMEDWGGIALNKYTQQQSLELAAVLQIALQIADILHALGQHRVVHKDIKPANILIHPESKQVKLIDFSIASLLPKETQEIQNPNILEGTLAYLAPEQTGRMNRGIDYRADFYSLGVTLYQLLTGVLPFASKDPLELVHCHIAKIPPSVDHLNPEVPETVAAIVTKLMAKNAEDRYQSALGLQHDLDQCLRQWQATGDITKFELGQRDLSDRFLIPETLYGRETEVKTLLDAFDRVAHGAAELMLVAGFSGIGKTAVVNEVHKPITRQRGHFIKGKFDQFNRNIPLSAFVQACRDLMGQLLSESDEALTTWKSKILKAVGENGQVLIDVIPELEQVIGPQPAATELSGAAAQNRFNLLFQKFIAVFTTPKHPLVMFLDDLQWADSASLNLMKVLMGESEQGYLLLLGAYRDNEVFTAHPLMLTLTELEKQAASISTIMLAPLRLTEINQLVAETLTCTSELAQPLSQLIYQKTQGNPFFATQFLKGLHDDGLIVFSTDLGYWECDLAKVQDAALTNDVVAFMSGRLQKLSQATQDVLKSAACIGNQFDLETLAIVCESSVEKVAAELWESLREGLILPIAEAYKFFQTGTQEKQYLEDVVVGYRFLHDRIQQAAYALIPEAEKQKTHFNMGRQLLRNSSRIEQEERLFEIVSHLNLGRSLIAEPAEKAKLTQLNLTAARKAKASTAYQAAVDYLTIGIELLPENSWETDYDVTLVLHVEITEASYLNLDYEQMEQWANVTLQHTKTLLDTIPVEQTKLIAARSQGDLLGAIQIGLQVLRSLGVELPEQPTPEDIGQAYGLSRSLWQDKSPLELLDLPEMADPNRLAAMQILSWLVPCAYIGNPALMLIVIFKQVELSILYGNSPISIYGYGDYALVLCGVMNDIPSGFVFGQLALGLLEKLQANSFKSRLQYIFYYFTQHWKTPLRSALPELQKGYKIGLEIGELDLGCLNAAGYCVYSYHAGQELTDLMGEIEVYRQAIAQLKQAAPLSFLESYQQVVLNLLGWGDRPDQLTGEICNAEKLAQWQETNNRTALFYAYLNQLFLSYLFGQYEDAAEAAALTEQYIDSGTATFLIPIYSFYDALVQLALDRNASEADQAQTLARVEQQQQKLQDWAGHSPENHQHRCDLIAAERASLVGDRLSAVEYYDCAIAAANANGFIQEEALANELAAKFYLDWNKEKIAQEYLTHAYYGYAQWGAKAKVQDLERCYPQLLAPILQQRQVALSATETVVFTESLATVQSPGTQSSSFGSISISATLDLATILKAYQALSSEIQLEKLLATLLHTVLENAGADKGALLMPREDQWFVEAIATLDQPAQVQSIALSQSSDVSQGLVNTVKHSLEPVVIVDATLHPTLGTDPYVERHQPQSMLCTPILNQGKLVAILYLENQVTTGVFTGDRVELLNLLCAQAAISLENARLYQQAQAYAQQLEQSQLQIVQSEKMASLGNLVAGVAHEINNPIGFLKGSICNGTDYVQDLLEHLALYQQHYPDSVEPIQDHAEEIDLDFMSEDVLKLLGSMKGATDRIKSISNSLRTFSRADTTHKVSANLHEGIDSTLLILKYRLKANEQRPAIDVIKDYGEVPTLDCFPGQLNQVFMNILANAIDMFDEEAQTRSFAELEANPQQVTIRSKILQNQVQISISDNGRGMSEAVKAKVFDHLFTTKDVGKGTGLGLAIARQIVEDNHGGSLTVQSEMGRGTEFCIHLPTRD
jgi:predicted ATPase/signal transduction histidine kinase